MPVLSLLLAFIVAGLALFLSGSLDGKQAPIETVVHAVAPESPSVVEEVPSVDPQALQDQLEEIAGEHAGTYGIAVLDPTSGTRISLRGNERFMVASIGKLPVLATLYRAAARGELDLDEEISMIPEDIQDYGNGEPFAVPEDDSLTLRECAFRMINYSDNIAWSMLNRRLGEDKIRAELANMGIQNSWYSVHLSGYFTTPDDVLLLLEKISDPQFTSEKLSAEMLDDMTNTAFEDRIPMKLPLSVRVAHKIGSYDDNFGDAGVLFYTDSQGVEKHYYLVVLAEGTNEYDARGAIQDMSLAVYEALTGVKVDPGWARAEEPAPYLSGIDSLPELWPSLDANAQGYAADIQPANAPLDDQYGVASDLPAGHEPAPDPAASQPGAYDFSYREST